MGGLERWKVYNDPKVGVNGLSAIVGVRSSAEYIILDDTLAWECGE